MKKGAMASLLLCLTVFILTGSAMARSNKIEIEPPKTDPLVSHTLVQEAGWNYNWQINFPLKTGETLDYLNVFGKNLLAMTSTNMVFCVDQATGRVRSFVQIAPAGLPVSRPAYFQDKIWYMVGNEVQVFDPSAGVISFRRKFPQVGNSHSKLARNSAHLFIAGSDNRLHAINTDGYWQEFEASADNDSAIVSIIATDSMVVFATQAGNVVGMNAAAPQKLWQFDATGAIQGNLELDDSGVYFGSEDSKLYKLDLTTGQPMWPSPFHSGGPIRDGLTVGRKIVYVYNDLNGLYGINKETGKPVWQVPSGLKMICETDGKSFVYARLGVLKVMDNNSGKELYAMNFADVNRTVQNRLSPVMYLGDQAGRLMSISVK